VSSDQEVEWSGTDDAGLTSAIQASSGTDPVHTTLRTDGRVLARVTDGIYRQPGSAIRELISNAYDADASQVVIKTDRPRFDTISIEDDGIGMSPATVAHLVRHIGGSPKRTADGPELGVTDASDPSLSPAGRKLIGKIGIGLFSIAQLTDRFQIITKTQGDPFRTIATVVLKQFTEDHALRPGEGTYEAGKVNIWREPAVDQDMHGTSIVLTAIRPQTRDTLQSRDLWLTVDADVALAPEDSQGLKPPRFHIGRVDPDNPNYLRGGAEATDSLPWQPADSPAQAFRTLVDAVWAEAQQGAVPNPQLEQIFDYYLRMAWLQIGLAIPSPYVDGHPFDIAFGDSVYAYELPENPRTPPRELVLRSGQTVRHALGLGAGLNEGEDFEVIFDDLQIRRPLRFRDLPSTAHQVKKPILFIGTCQEEFPNVPSEFSSGPLEFDAYLMWAPKIVPTEHQGVLIRIHGSSGTLFDPTFMRYQVSEQTRLRQITCEIFVRNGLEGALNIDRESFNYSHPHVVYVTKWLHAALRRIATVQKRIASEIRGEARRQGEHASEARLETIVSTAWRKEADDEGQVPPRVTFVDTSESQPTGTSEGEATADGYRFQRSAIFGAPSPSAATNRRDRSLERKLIALVQLLAAYGLFDKMGTSERDRLVASLREILEADEG
jgi:hypothetical protein